MLNVPLGTNAAAKHRAIGARKGNIIVTIGRAPKVEDAPTPGSGGGSEDDAVSSLDREQPR